jgi:hypothetical protein
VVAITICLAGITVFSGCQKDDPTVIDDGVYTPPENLTHEQILTLLDNAEKMRLNARQNTMTTTFGRAGDNGIERWKLVRAYDIDAKKAFCGGFGNQGATMFVYIESTDVYGYRSADIYPPTDAYALFKSITDADNFYKTFQYILFLDSEAIRQRQNYTWTVENGILKGRGSYESFGGKIEQYEVTLNANKQYKKVEFSGEKLSNGKILFVHSNIILPSGFNKSDFINDDSRSQYLSAKVIWGEGKGENTFWANTTLSLDNISRYAPEIAGKKIAGCTIGNTTYTYNNGVWENSSSITLTDNNTIINVIWE